MQNSRTYVGKLWAFVLVTFFVSNVLSQSGQIIPGEYIVKFKMGQQNQSGQQKATFGVAAKAASEKGLRVIGQFNGKFRIQKMIQGAAMMQISSQTAQDIDQLRSNPDVEYIEPNRRLSLDPVKVEQLGTAPQGSDSYSQSYSAVKVTEAWAIEKAYNVGSKVIVAVIDTGLDLNHGIIKDSGSIWENTAEKNGAAGVDDDKNGYIDDINGWNFVARSGSMFDDADHGTHVAGIVIGTGMDILALPVRESRHKIMPLKFLDGNGSGTTADAVNAMYYAINNGAKIINNSWGGPSYSLALHEAYTYAYNNGVVVVTAAGNSAVNIDSTPMYPAALDTPSNITVIATSDSDNRASFSNYSAVLTQVGAPGVSIVSSVPGTGCANPGCFAMMSGTSMAAPFVAGLAGLIQREAPQLSAYQIRGIVLSSIDTVPVLATRTQTSGRVNALTAIQSAKSNASTQTWSPSYVPAYKAETRSPSSEAASPKAGCGLVKVMMDATGSGGSGPLNTLLVFSILLAPLLVAFGMRRNKESETQVDGINRRQFVRYQVVREIAIKVGDQVYQAASQSLSLGGLSFSDQTKFEKGQKIKVQLDKHGDEVDAEIVWCSTTNSYGVKFAEITDSLKNRITLLTYGANPV